MHIPGLSQWSGIFANDKVVTTAILDRLLHHSHVINILGDSYRLKEKKEEEMNGSDLYTFEPRNNKKQVLLEVTFREKNLRKTA